MKHAFFKIAKSGNNNIGLYIAGIIMIIIASFIGQIPLVLAAFIKKYNPTVDNSDEVMTKLSEMDFAYFDMSLNTAFFLLILSFVIGFLGIVFSIRIFHKRTLKSLISPFDKIRWSRIALGFGVWLGMAIISEGISYYIDPDNYIVTFDSSKFLGLLIICLLFLPFQTSFEELFIRGYLMQGMSLLTKNPLIPLIVSSLIFGLLHGFNPEVFKYGFAKMMFFYIGMGLFLAIITIMDEGLELALGVHFANNLFAALFVSYEGGALQTYSIFKSLNINMDYMVLGFTLNITIFIIIIAFILKWKDWKKIFENIVYYEESNNNDILDDMAFKDN